MAATEAAAMATGDGASKEAEVEAARAALAAAESTAQAALAKAAAAESAAQAALADAAQAAEAGARRTKTLEDQCEALEARAKRSEAVEAELRTSSEQLVQALEAIKGKSKEFITGLSEEKKGLEGELERARRAYAEAPLIASRIRLSPSDCLPQ